MLDDPSIPLAARLFFLVPLLSVPFVLFAESSTSERIFARLVPVSAFMVKKFKSLIGLPKRAWLRVRDWLDKNLKPPPESPTDMRHY